MQGNREIVIRHGTEAYRLSVTRSGKLILRKSTTPIRSGGKHRSAHGGARSVKNGMEISTGRAD